MKFCKKHSKFEPCAGCRKAAKDRDEARARVDDQWDCVVSPVSRTNYNTALREDPHPFCSIHRSYLPCAKCNRNDAQSLRLCQESREHPSIFKTHPELQLRDPKNGRYC